MKRSVVLFMFFFVLSLVLAGFAWTYRDGLARLPGDKAFSLQSPQSAFPMPDGGFAVVDSGSRRIVRFNATGLVRWEIRPQTLFGRFLAVDAAPDGMLYGIDESVNSAGPMDLAGSAIDTTVRRQRLVRIGLDGSLAAVLLERTVAGRSGFIPGSLRVHEGVLWYLYDDGTSIVLADFDTTTLTEHVAGRSEWSLDRASVAPGGPGNSVAVAAEGALAFFQRERFETLSEYAARLPYPACVRYDNAGNLYIADPVAGVILRTSPEGGQELILPSTDVAGPALIPGFAFDSFAIGPEGLVLVDRQSPAVLVVDPGSGKDSAGVSGQARIVRELSRFTVPEAEAKRSLLAWLVLAGSLASGLVALALLVYISASFAPRPLALAGASLPGLLGTILVLSLAWYSGELGRQSDTEAASLERLRAAAVAGAGALSALDVSGVGAGHETSPGILADASAGVAHPRSSSGWDILRRRLASMVYSSPGSNWPAVSAVLYLESAGTFRYICDSDGLHIPGMAQPMVPDSYSHAVSLHRAVLGAVDSGGQRWLSAAAPLDTPAGGPAVLLEMTSPAYVAPPGSLMSLLSLHVPEPPSGLLLAVFILGLAALSGLPLLVSSRRETAELSEYRARLSSIDDKRRAVAALKSGNADEARRILEVFVERNPEDMQARNNLGAAYARLGMRDEALGCFEEVVRAQPENAAAKANLARLKAGQTARSSSSRENRR
ncbi:MAG: tetratricopeptide repeat protein [Clostridia bacterium]